VITATLLNNVDKKQNGWEVALWNSPDFLGVLNAMEATSCLSLTLAVKERLLNTRLGYAPILIAASI